MSDTVLVFTALFSLIGTMFTGYMAYLVLKLNKKTDEVSVHTQDVKSALSTSQLETTGKLIEIAKVSEATHILVNDVHRASLRMNVELATRIATLTGSVKDREVADTAKRVFDDHSDRQLRGEVKDK